MANIHPSLHAHAPLGAGEYQEREVLRILEDGLPDSFDVFHNLHWSSMQDDVQRFGEYDLVVVSPGGALLILEVKAGNVDANGDKLTKQYGRQGPKDIGQQMRRQHASLLQRIKDGGLPRTHVGAMLVLTDARLEGEIVGYPRERIVDAGQLDQLCTTIQASFPADFIPPADRQQVLDFLSNRFAVLPDVATHIGQVRRTTVQLSSGLATWVPRVTHADNLYQIEATAGSGKTQLALALLREAAARGGRARYICFNRPLADHVAQLAPATCEVTTFHQLCRDHAERQGVTLDFEQPGVFTQMTGQYVQDAPQLPARLNLLIVDEAQDLEPEWVEALSQGLLTNGKLYVMGDSQQQLYDREPFDLPGAVQVRCMDNFRSPQQIVQAINRLKLVPEPIHARGIHMGQSPNFHVLPSGENCALATLESCLNQLWKDGYSPDQVAVISYRGVQQSDVLHQDRLDGRSVRRFTGAYDTAGNPLWTDGDLLVESLYRFKGQSAPAVVLCEIDFEALTPRDRRKLFVGLTRAQVRVDLVLSERAAAAIAAELD